MSTFPSDDEFEMRVEKVLEKKSREAQSRHRLWHNILLERELTDDELLELMKISAENRHTSLEGPLNVQACLPIPQP
jgi:hypothetical protein